MISFHVGRVAADLTTLGAAFALGAALAFTAGFATAFLVTPLFAATLLPGDAGFDLAADTAGSGDAEVLDDIVLVVVSF